MRINKLWKKYFISYLLILSIPIFVSIFIYQKNVKLLTDNLYVQNEKLVENCAELIDLEILNIDNIVKYFSKNPDINILTTLTRGAFTKSSEYYKVIKASYPIHSFPINQTMIYDIQVYSSLNNSLISSNRVHTELEREYEPFLKWENLSYEEWNKDILNSFFYKELLSETKIVTGDGHLKKVIPYISTIPLNSKGYSKGSIIVYLDLDKINDLLNKINRVDKGITYFFDSNNKLITSVGYLKENIDIISLANYEKANIEIKEIEKKNYFITQNTSELTGYKIISILPTSYITDQIKYIKYFGILIILATIVCSLLLCLIISYKKTKPILEIAEIAKVDLNEESNKINTIEQIRENLTSIMEDNKSLSTFRDEQIEQNKNIFFERWLNGVLDSKINCKKQLEFFGININSQYYCVMIINIIGYRDLENKELFLKNNLIKLFIIKLLEENKEIEGFHYFNSFDQITYILTKDIFKKQKVILTRLIDRIENEMNIKIIVSLGNPCVDINNISFSFGQANYAMQYLKNNLVIKYISYYQLQDLMQLMYYPLEIENRIIHLTLQGYSEQLDSLCSLIYSENFEEKNLSIQMKSQLISNFNGTLNRIISRGEKNFPLFEINQKLKTIDTEEEKFCYVRNLLIKIAKEKNNKLENNDKVILSKFCQFIENNYSDKTLNISVLSKEFNYKEAYIYSFFINNLHISFASYLEKVRMEKAKKLLLDGKISVKDVATSCGYSSPHSFRRAFKRITLVTPSEYKK